MSLPFPGGAGHRDPGSPLTLRQRDLMSKSSKLMSFSFKAPLEPLEGTESRGTITGAVGHHHDYDGHGGHGHYDDEDRVAPGTAIDGAALSDVIMGPNEAIAVLQQRLVQQKADAAAAARAVDEAERAARWGALDAHVTQQVAGGVGAATSAAELGMSDASRALLVGLERGSSIDVSLSLQPRSTAAAAAALLVPGGNGGAAKLSLAATAGGGVSPRARGLRATAREAAHAVLPPRAAGSELEAPLARAALMKALTGARTAAGLPPRLDSAQAGARRRSIASVTSLGLADPTYSRPASRHMTLGSARSIGPGGLGSEMMAMSGSASASLADYHHEAGMSRQGSRPVSRSVSPPSRGSSGSPSRSMSPPASRGSTRPGSRGTGTATGRVRLQPLLQRRTPSRGGRHQLEDDAPAVTGQLEAAGSGEANTDSQAQDNHVVQAQGTVVEVEDHHDHHAAEGSADAPRLSSAGWPFASADMMPAGSAFGAGGRLGSAGGPFAGSSGPTLEAARNAIRRASVLIDSVALPTGEDAGSTSLRNASHRRRQGHGMGSLSPSDSAARMRNAPLVHGVAESQRVQAARRGDAAAKHAQLAEWLHFAGELGLRDTAAASTGSGGLHLTAASDVVAGEARLQSARAFSEPMGRPADLPTAAAFALMDAVLSTMGRAPAGSLPERCAAPLRECQAVLLQATYAELALGPQASASIAGAAIGRGVPLLTVGPSATEEISQAGFPPMVIPASGAAAAAQAALAASPLPGGPLSSPLKIAPVSPVRAFGKSKHRHETDSAVLTLLTGSPGATMLHRDAKQATLALSHSATSMPVASFAHTTAATASASSSYPGPLLLRRYYGLSSYAALSAALAAERDLLSAALGELAATLEAWEGARKREIAGTEMRTRVARKWQLLAFRELRRRQAAQQGEVIESQRQAIASLQMLLAPGAEAVTAAFARLPSDSDRTEALLSVLSAAAASWAPALRFLVTQLPLDVLLRLLGSALGERADLGLTELAAFIGGMMKNPRVKGAVVTVSAADGAAAGAAAASVPAGGSDGSDEGGVTSRATSRGRSGSGTAPPPPPRLSARPTARGSATSRGDGGGGLLRDLDASDAIGLDSPHGGTSAGRFTLPIQQPAPSVPSSGQAFVLREIVAGLSGTEWSGLLPALLPALAPHDAASALRFFCGLDTWPLPPRDLRRHVTGGTPPQAPPQAQLGHGLGGATSRSTAATVTSRSAAGLGGIAPTARSVAGSATAQTASNSDVWKPVPGVKSPLPANAFEGIVGATSKVEQGALLRLLLRRAGATAWHAFLDALLPSRSGSAGSKAGADGGDGEDALSDVPVSGRSSLSGRGNMTRRLTMTDGDGDGAGSPAAGEDDRDDAGTTGAQGQLADAIRTADAASKAAALSLIAEGMSAEDLSLALKATVTLLPPGTMMGRSGEAGSSSAGTGDAAIGLGAAAGKGERARSARRSIGGGPGELRSPQAAASKPRSRANSISSSAASSERGSDSAAEGGADAVHGGAAAAVAGLLVAPLHLRASSSPQGVGSAWTGLSTRSPLFLRYVASPVRLPRGARPLPRLRAEEALAIVYDAYAAKAAEDLAADMASSAAVPVPASAAAAAAGAAASGSKSAASAPPGSSASGPAPRLPGHPLMQTVTPLAEWLRGHLLRRCGIPSSADAHLLALAEAVRRLAPRSARLRMFGRASGLIEGSRSGAAAAAGAGLPGDATALGLGSDSGAYSQRAGTVLLALLQGAVPAFTARDIRDLPEGRAFIPLDDALAATEGVFTRYNVAAATRRIMLTGGRKALLTKAVKAAAEPYADAVAAAAAAAATARAEEAPLTGTRRSSARAVGEGDAATATANSSAGSSLAGFNDLSALAQPIAAAVSKGTSAQGSRTLQAARPVVDLDVWLSLCMSVWQAQVAEDATGIARLFRSFAGKRPVISVDVSARHDSRPCDTGRCSAPAI